MRIEQIAALPTQIDALREDALAEGFDNIETLWHQWHEEGIRFSRPGEMLVAAFVGEDFVGIGGITEDFLDASWLRMRRFYVRPQFRRQGVGKAIADYLISRALPLQRPIVLYTDTARAATFWQTVGFIPTIREKTTHILPR